MSPLNVGIIGFGRIGAEHSDWVAAARGVAAVAVADATPARQELARRRGLKVYPDVGSLLADADVHAVLVATPTAMHQEHATQALRSGRHVLVEKPMALDLDQSKKLVEEAAAAGRVLSVFQNRRWDLDYLTVRRAVAGGAFGTIINVESRLGQWASCVGPAAREYRPGWRNEAAFGGGGLYDWGSHFVDQMWRLLWPAKPLRVFAQLRGNVWTSDCDDFARLLIDFDNGAAGLVEINTTTTRPGPRWHIDGSSGSGSSPHSPAFDLAVWATLEFTPAPREAGAPAAAPRILPLADLGLSEVGMWEMFAAATRGDGDPAVPVETVLPTMALLDAARESARTGKAVEVGDKVRWVP